MNHSRFQVAILSGAGAARETSPAKTASRRQIVARNFMRATISWLPGYLRQHSGTVDVPEMPCTPACVRVKFLHFASWAWPPCGVAVSVYVLAASTPVTVYVPEPLVMGSVTVAVHCALLYA